MPVRDAVVAEVAPAVLGLAGLVRTGLVLTGLVLTGLVLTGLVVGGTVGAATGTAIVGVVTGDAASSMAALDGVLTSVHNAMLAATTDAASKR